MTDHPELDYSLGLAKRVLVVDDEPEILEFFQDFLAAADEYQVRVAADGSEVSPLLSAFRPHLVITDMRMPRQGGLSVIRLVKEHDEKAEVIVITGHGRIDEAVEAMKLGASDFIPKPFEIEQMQSAIDKCFNRIRLRQQNAALRYANQELQRLTELKEKFLRLTSHELRGPLTILQGYCDLLSLWDDLPAEIREARQAMQAAVSNLTTIVQNLTLLMVAKSDQMPLARQRFDVMDTLRATLEEIKVHARHREHQYALAGPPRLDAVGDPLRVTQIARELLFNAVKFTPDRGVIRVAVSPENASRFLISVQDNGIGMASSEIVSAFEPFYEAANTRHHSTSRTNFKGGGLGIGLTLVRDIVEAYGGRVSIMSEPGRGTTVTVALPLQCAPPGKAPGEEAA